MVRMAVPFGFGVDDFLAAIELITRISKALKKNGGAEAECRLVLEDLQLLKQTLELLQALQPNDANFHHINAVKGMAITCLVHLREFAEKLDRSYGPSLARGSTSNFIKRGGKMIQWTMFSTDEVSKFRTIVAAKVISISILLGASNSEMLLKVHASAQESKESLQDHAVRSERRSNEHFADISLRISRNHDDLLANVVQLREESRMNVSSHQKQNADQHQSVNQRLSEQQEAVQQLDSRLKTTFRDAKSHYRRLVGVCCGLRLTNQQMLEESRLESREIKMQIRSVAREQRGIRSEIIVRYKQFIFQVKVLQSIGEKILNLLIPFSQRVLDYLRRNTAQNAEIYTTLLHLQEQMSKTVTTGEDDVIKFEDVLGRTRNLPYEYFRHWEVFESMLHCEFKSLPGESKVLSGKYRLFNYAVNGAEIDKAAWGKQIFPKSIVKMSVEVKFVAFDQAEIIVICPRCHNSIETITRAEKLDIQCSTCSMNFISPEPPGYRFEPGLPVFGKASPAQRRAKPAFSTLASYLDPARNLHFSSILKAHGAAPIKSISQIRTIEAQEMTAFRLVNIKSVSLDLSDEYSNKNSHRAEVFFTSQDEDEHLVEYLRAILVNDSSILNDRAARQIADNVVHRQLSAKPLFLPKSEQISRAWHLKHYHSAICQIINDHIRDLANDIEQHLAGSHNSIHSLIDRILVEDIWPAFVKRMTGFTWLVQKLGRKRNESGWRLAKMTKPLSVLSHAYLDMLSFAEHIGCEPFRRLVREKAFSYKERFWSRPEIEILYETEFKHKFAHLENKRRA